MSVITQKLRDFTILEKGKPPKQQPYFGQDAELYLTPEFLRGKSSAEIVKPSHNAVRVTEGDTIILWDGSNAGEVFRAKEGILASTMSRITHDDTFDKNYFYYAVKSQELYLKGQTSGSGIPHVDKEIFGKIEIHQFDRIEQAKISEILTTVDRAIEQTEALIAKQQRIKTGLMQDLLTRGIDEHGNLRSEQTHQFKDSPLGRISVEWEMAPLLSFASNSPDSFVNGPFGSDLLASELQAEGVPVIYIRDINPGAYRRVSTVHVTQAKANQLVACNVHFGDILVAKVGDPPCDAAVYTEQQRAIVTQDVIRIRSSKEVDPGFLCHLLNSHFGRNAVLGIITRGTRARVSLTEFKALKLPKPSHKEQNAVAEALESIQRDVQRREFDLSKLILLKTALMQDLLTGKKRVTALLDFMGVTN